LTQSQPTSSTVWSVGAAESAAVSDNWSLQAFAICLTGP
jgi:hypothetical protein